MTFEERSQIRNIIAPRVRVGMHVCMRACCGACAIECVSKRQGVHNGKRESHVSRVAGVIHLGPNIVLPWHLNSQTHSPRPHVPPTHSISWRRPLRPHAHTLVLFVAVMRANLHAGCANGAASRALVEGCVGAPPRQGSAGMSALAIRISRYACTRYKDQQVCLHSLCYALTPHHVSPHCMHPAVASCLRAPVMHTCSCRACRSL